MPLPLLLIKLENKDTMLINETQVVSVRRLYTGSGRLAVVRMSNGDEHIVADPPYELWENDYLIRKG